MDTNKPKLDQMDTNETERELIGGDELDSTAEEQDASLPVEDEESEEESEEEESEEESEEEESEEDEGKDDPKKEFDLSKIKDKKIREEVRKEIEYLNDKVEKSEEFKQDYITANNAINEAFYQEPVVAEFMKDILSGMSLRASINKHFDIDDLKLEEGDPDESEVLKAKDEAKKARKQKEKMLETLQNNRIASENDAKEFAEENGLKSKQAEAFFSRVDGFLNDAYEGRLTKEFFEIINKGLNHEAKVEAAVKTAEIRLKNMKIKEQRIKKEAQKDGLPNLTGKSKMTSRGDEDHSGGLFTAIRRFEQNQIF